MRTLMRTFKGTVILSAVLTVALSACGQNPHVLGPDAQNTDRRNGPVVDSNGTPGDGNQGKPGNGKPGQHQPKEGCVFAAQLMTFDSRPLVSSEKGSIEIASTLGFAVDVGFESPVIDVTSAKLVMYNLSPEKVKSNPGAAACFKNKDVCGPFEGTDSISFNLLHHVDHSEIASTLNAEKSLFFSVPADLESRDAQLQLEVLFEKCAPKGE